MSDIGGIKCPKCLNLSLTWVNGVQVCKVCGWRSDGAEPGPVAKPPKDNVTDGSQ